MKFEIGAEAYYVIDVPNYTIEDYENGNYDPIYETFWDKYHHNKLDKEEIYEIDCFELIEN